MTFTVTEFGQGMSKTAGTTLSGFVSQVFNAGDIIVVHFGMDPAAGTVSITTLTGITVGTWNKPIDVSKGSGTSGVRGVVLWGVVTVGGTLTAITITHPSATARAMTSYRLQGPNPGRPTNGFNSSTASSTGLVVTPTNTGYDTLALTMLANESATLGAVSPSLPSGGGTWTADSNTDTLQFGTSGSSGASNISISAGMASAPAITGNYTCGYASGAASNFVLKAIGFQAPLLPNPVAVTTSQTTAVTPSFSYNAGDTLLVCCPVYGDPTSGGTISDTAGLTWVQRANIPQSSNNLYVWEAKPLTGGSTVVTIGNISGSNKGVSVVKIPASATFVSETHASSTAPNVSVTDSPASADNLCIAFGWTGGVSSTGQVTETLPTDYLVLAGAGLAPASVAAMQVGFSQAPTVGSKAFNSTNTFLGGVAIATILEYAAPAGGGSNIAVGEMMAA